MGRRRRGRVCLTAGLAGACLFGAASTRAQGADARDVTVTIGTRALTMAQVERAYEKVWHQHVVENTGARPVRAHRVGAVRIEGPVVAMTSGRRVIVRSGGRLHVVALRFGANPAVGERVRLMAVRSPAPTFSYRPPNGERRSLPHYDDVTLSLNDLIVHARRGVHFPGAPELGTRPNRVGMFATGSGVEDRAERLIRDRQRQHEAERIDSAHNP